MKFRLGVVGHRETLLAVSELVDEYFDDVQVRTQEFGNDEVLTQAVERIDSLQQECDGILYSRRDPYILIASQLQHTVPVRYVTTGSSDLLISLLTAITRYGIRPHRFSIDSFDTPTALDSLERAGFDRDRLEVQTINVDSGEQGFVKATLKEHLRNFAAGAQVCITNITDVHNSLQEEGVPTAIIRPSPESFVHEIRNLLLRHQLRSGDAANLAIVHIRLRYKEKFRYYGALPIREVDDLSKAAKLVAVFAEELDSAMFQLSRWEYLVLCNRELLEAATDQFMEFGLMSAITHQTAFDAALGVGCGSSVKEAEANALRALGETESHLGTHAIVVDGNGELRGPVRPRSERFPAESTTEANLAQIAASSGVSIQMLTRLYEVAHSRNSPLFTSNQLARHLGVSSRTVNRTVGKLLEHRYALVEGKDLTQPSGRPARVFRLLL